MISKVAQRTGESDAMARMMGDPPARHEAIRDVLEAQQIAERDARTIVGGQKPTRPDVPATNRRYLVPTTLPNQAGLRVRIDQDGRFRISSGLYRVLSQHVPNTPIPKLYVRLALIDTEIVFERCDARDQWAGLVSTSTNMLNHAYSWAELQRIGYRAGWFHAEVNQQGTEATIRPGGYLGERLRRGWPGRGEK